MNKFQVKGRPFQSPASSLMQSAGIFRFCLCWKNKTLTVFWGRKTHFTPFWRSLIDSKRGAVGVTHFLKITGRPTQLEQDSLEPPSDPFPHPNPSPWTHQSQSTPLFGPQPVSRHGRVAKVTAGQALGIDCLHCMNPRVTRQEDHWCYAYLCSSLVFCWTFEESQHLYICESSWIWLIMWKNLGKHVMSNAQAKYFTLPPERNSTQLGLKMNL